MRYGWLNVGLLLTWAPAVAFSQAPNTPAPALPPPAARTVDFAREVKPIFEASCVQCHGRGKDKGGFRLDSRETVLHGGDSGAAVLVGNSAQSLLIALVQGVDPDNIMPRKGSRLTPEQVGVLRAWIDQGAVWDTSVTFARREPANLRPRQPSIPSDSKAPNPVDRFLAPYFAAHKIKAPAPVSDRVFARRVYLDVVGLLSTPPELAAFLADRHKDKRERLVDSLLGRDRDYAQHWLSFWNDLLRNDYKGTGYIDGGRKQITRWLYSALLTNMPYDKFVAELVNPTPESEGFTKGIVWRGVVNASQTPQMQAAQNIAQVFMGVNLKCASCHDSFINDLTLADAYGLAGIYADGPLEMVHCDKPTGQTAELKFLYPELGAIAPGADKPSRLRRLAEIITQRQDARLTRTLANRLWQRFLGRGLIEPVDDMEKTAWSPDLLDWLAEDFTAHRYDVKHLVRQILTSRAYQLPAVNLDEQIQQDFVFRGPAVRRLSAEQFRDALTSLTGAGYSAPAAEITPGALTNRLAAAWPGKVRAALVAADPLMVALARPNREQVVTTRPPTATTLQALELMNGETLAEVLKRGAGNLLAQPGAPKGDPIAAIYSHALGRKPSRAELRLARELVGKPIQPAGVEDLLWSLAMLPEFQLIY